MTVKEVFELRKQGKIEEAYEAIRPMYAVHKGHYTTLCMFWTANDVLKKRVKEGRTEEAGKIFEALLRMLPTVDDRDGRAHTSMLYNAIMLSKNTPTFSMLSFLERYGVNQLSEADWKSITPSSASATGKGSAPSLPSPAHQLLTRAFHEIQQQPTVDKALKVMPLLQEAMRRTPRDKNCLRCMSMVYNIMGETQKSADIAKLLT